MKSEPCTGAFGPHFDLSHLFPGGIFAFVTLRGFGPVDPEGLGAFLAGMGYGRTEVHSVRQVHSGLVVEAPETPCEADAVIVRGPGRAARILTADCVPVLLARADGAASAAVHAGWKGTLAGIAASAARALGSPEAPVAAYIGPGIGPCCYSVPPERTGAFRRAFPHFHGAALGPPGHLDLAEINRLQLLAAGLAPGDIHREDCCTSCSPELCWSYRRDGAAAGRMASLVGRPEGGWAPFR